MIVSIDQNCHSLWDAVPKCQVLSRRGEPVRHFVEDIDVAFTAIGSQAGGDRPRLARERWHHSGAADWGAALFYCGFLGRLPVDLRWWEPLVGMKTAALARQLGQTVEDLYDKYSPADNWQLIAPSYVGDRRHHRIIADISVAEAAEPLRQLMDIARADMLERFPQRAAQERIGDWFAVEGRRVADLLAEHAGGKLVNLYRAWTGQVVGESVELGLASSLAGLSADAPAAALLEMFCRDYDQAAELYNDSLRRTPAAPSPLDTAAGELPFFAAMNHQGRSVRVNVRLADGGIRIADEHFPLRNGRVPLDELRAAGVWGLSGKAVMLAIQVRWGPDGAELALPYRGSSYMPAAQHLAARLVEEGLLTGEVRPLVRVRFHLLDRLGRLDTILRLPEHLAACFGAVEVPASRLAAEYGELARQAAERLEGFGSDDGRRQWQRENCPALAAEADRLDARRRELAARDPKSPAIREVWKQLKAVQTDLLAATLSQIATDWHMRDIDYWDSRGAIWPWCVAAGGKEFYNHVVAEAEVYREPAQRGNE